MHNDHGEVGRASGKGLAPASCRRDLQDGSHDEGIGEEDEEKGDQHHEDAQKENDQSFVGTLRAAELQDRGDVAEEVLHTVSAAEGRGEYHGGLDHSHREPGAEH